MSKNLSVWIEATIIAALATALSFIPLNIGPSFSITVGQPVLVLYALRRGLKPGLAAGFLWGVLHILVGTAYILTPLQGFIEYFVAFGFTGFAGLWANKMRADLNTNDAKHSVLVIILASLVGTFARYFWHTIAGYYFWGQFAPEGWSPWLYSITMNSISALATGTFTIVVLLIVLRTTPQLFIPKNNRQGY